MSEMTLNDARKKIRQITRFARMFQDIEEVLDVAITSEDQSKLADLHVKNSRDELDALENDKEVVRLEVLALAAAQEDMKRQGQALSEQLTTYEKSVEVRMAALDGEYEKKGEEYDEAMALMDIKKVDLLQEVTDLRAEKAQIESVVEAFRKANVGSEA